MTKSSSAENLEAIHPAGPNLALVTAVPEGHIKKVPVSSLRPGMFICDFNAGWMAHPFLLNRLDIRTEAEIAEIISYGIDSVFIDTRRGIDVADAVSLEEVVESSRNEMLGSTSEPLESEAGHLPARPPSAEEIRRARQVLSEASLRLQQALSDARLGKPIDMPALRDSVEQISASVIRNSDAIVGRGEK